MEENNRKNNIIENNIINSRFYTVIIYIIKYLLIINLFIKTKNNIFNFYYFQLSKISLKIRGTGENTILGNKSSNNFKGINYLNEVHINRKKQNSIEYKYLFNQTNNIVELIWKDDLTNCENMFMGCSNIIEINFSFFDTSHITNMVRMFRECSSLTSLDLSNFNTSLVEEMNGMFRGCLSLSSLNLSNFDISSATKTHNMFYNCTNLEYINIKNFYKNKLDAKSNYQDMFTFIIENVVICINNNTDGKISSQINLLGCPIFDCSNGWKSKQNKIVKNTNQCVESCENETIYKFEYNGKCIDNCENGFLQDNNNNITNKCKCQLEQCSLCPQVALNKNLCLECNTGYYEIENDPLNIGEYINCYKEPEGYYLDKNLYKKCYLTCKKCDKEGNYINHNCIECNDDFTIKIETKNYINCYKNCSDENYFDNRNNSICLDSFPENYYLDSNDNIYKECYVTCKTCTQPGNKINHNCDICIDNFIFLNNSFSHSKNCYNKSDLIVDDMMKNIQDYMINELNTTSIDNGKDLIISNEKLTYTITTTKNQKNQIEENVTTIDLGECETKLKKVYNISLNDSLYMLKIDIIIDNIPKIEYEVYYNFSSDNLTKLNLSVCEGIKIDIFIPQDIPINELDKYNKSSGFYNDICYTLTNDNGIDISLNDRQNDYKNNNLSICEEDCDFSEYNEKFKKAVCSCFTKTKMESISKIKVDKNKFFSNFKNIKNIGNFKMLSCIQLFFYKNEIFKNIANYMLIILLILSLVLILVFSLHDSKKIKILIDIIAKMSCFKFENKNIKTTDTIYKNLNKSKNNNIIKERIKVKIKIKNNNQKKAKKKYNKKYKKKMQNSSPNEFKNKSNFENNYDYIKILMEKKESLNIKNLKIILEFNDCELNELSYKIALIKDKRTFLQLYWSLIKTKHLLFFSFFYMNDYNSQMIKIFIFFFTFAMNLVISAMFYSDSTMHKIYTDEGSFDFVYQLPQMIYSFIISTILENLLNLLGLYEQDIIKYKNYKINNRNERNIYLRIKIKIIIFFVIIYVLLILFWIYLGCFCFVYKNTQIHLLLDVISSFCLSLVTPFFIILLPCIFRIISLRDKKGKRNLLYTFSVFLLNF